MPKKLQVLDQVHFKKIYNDRIRPPLVIFLAIFEKITTTGSSVNFLSPKPNGQGYDIDKEFDNKTLTN